MPKTTLINLIQISTTTRRPTLISTYSDSPEFSTTHEIDHKGEGNMFEYVATWGKAFTMKIPYWWKQRITSHHVISINVTWLYYDKTRYSVIGVPLGKLRNELVNVTLKQGTEDFNLRLNITITDNRVSDPSYFVTSQLILQPRSRDWGSDEIITLKFMEKISDFLPHVDLWDITILNVKFSQRVKISDVTVTWLIDKFSQQVFHENYFSLLIHKTGNQTFALSLLPHFVLQSILFERIEEITTTDHGSNAGVVVPVCVVVLIVFLSIASVILLHKRKKPTINSLLDTTYKKCRKPICLLGEIELDRFRPSKPRIIEPDVYCEHQSRDDVNNKITSRFQNFENEETQSGSYSFLQSVITPESDSSINSSSHSIFHCVVDLKKGK
ncbi:uncharacterized protein LOC108950944 [Ciona intestinalis]